LSSRCQPCGTVARVDDAASSVPAIEIVGLTRRFGDFTALDDVHLTIARGEFYSLLGPSGCGKTTLLRLIAGLDLPDAGEIRVGGRNANDIPAHRRPVNTVFQSYALFPHLRVRDNVAFGLRMRKVPAAEQERRVAAVMDLVQIAELADRKPAALSGGQKQRVALARALVNEPQVLLLDEPLGALDLKLRQELQRELRALQRRLGITFLHVTHDQEEALALSDRIAVMNGGRVQQVGAPAQLYERPRTRFVAQFLGSCNVIAGTVREMLSDRALVETPLGLVQAIVAEDHRRSAPGDACTLAVRPELLSTRAADAPRAPDEREVEVREVIYRGAGVELTVDCRGQPVRVHEPLRSTALPQPGQRRFLAPIEAGRSVVLED